MISLCVLAATAMATAAPKVGDMAPDFTAKDIDGKQITLSQLAQQGPVLLAFFPESFTPGCTQQLTGYIHDYQHLKEKSATVIAVSPDSADTLRRFKESLGAPFMFVSDPPSRLIKLYEVKGDDAHGRAAFVIDKKGRILRVDLGDAAMKTDKAITACNVPE